MLARRRGTTRTGWEWPVPVLGLQLPMLSIGQRQAPPVCAFPCNSVYSVGNPLCVSALPRERICPRMAEPSHGWKAGRDG